MQTAQELRDHYRAVRARLWAPPKPKALPQPPRLKTGSALIYRGWIGPFHPTDPRFVTKQTQLSLIKRIIAEVIDKHGLNAAQVHGDNRQQHVVACRFEMYWRLSQETTWSISRLAKYLNRDHTSLLWGIKKHRRKLEAGQ